MNDFFKKFWLSKKCGTKFCRKFEVKRSSIDKFWRITWKTYRKGDIVMVLPLTQHTVDESSLDTHHVVIFVSPLVLKISRGSLWGHTRLEKIYKFVNPKHAQYENFHSWRNRKFAVCDCAKINAGCPERRWSSHWHYFPNLKSDM